MSADHVITLGSRAGVAVSQPGDDAAGLLRRASVALAEAKAAESAPIRVIEDGAESETERGERLEVDLRRALDRGEIEILFQPQVSVTSGEVLGGGARALEAPALWRARRLTLFSVAERSDYLAVLSDHVQRRAIAAAAAWPEALARLRLSVNITAADIRRPGFADQFLELDVRETGFPAERLTVEVTESGLTSPAPRVCSRGSVPAASGLRSTISVPAIRASLI